MNQEELPAADIFKAKKRARIAELCKWANERHRDYRFEPDDVQGVQLFDLNHQSQAEHMWGPGSGTPEHMFSDLIARHQVPVRSWRIGDRVRCLAPLDPDEGWPAVGQYGRVVELWVSGPVVEWDDCDDTPSSFHPDLMQLVPPDASED